MSTPGQCHGKLKSWNQLKNYVFFRSWMPGFVSHNMELLLDILSSFFCVVLRSKSDPNPQILTAGSSGTIYRVRFWMSKV